MLLTESHGYRVSPQFHFKAIGYAGNFPAYVVPFDPGTVTPTHGPIFVNPVTEGAVPLGDVAYEYAINAFEVTNAVYVNFLNTVDPKGDNHFELWSPFMQSEPLGGILKAVTADDGKYYSAKSNFENRPVNFVTTYSAMRFANSLQNANRSHNPADLYKFSKEINSGSYTLEGDSATPSNQFPKRNPLARFVLPSEDEWIKAAYYDPTIYTTPLNPYHYWFYTTRSNTESIQAIIDLTTGMIKNGGLQNDYNVANYGNSDGTLSVVGTADSPSFFGTSDQGGSVVELTDTISIQDSSQYNVHGGTYEQPGYSLWLSATGREPPTLITDRKGFRVGYVYASYMASYMGGLARFENDWYWNFKLGYFTVDTSNQFWLWVQNQGWWYIDEELFYTQGVQWVDGLPPQPSGNFWYYDNVFGWLNTNYEEGQWYYDDNDGVWMLYMSSDLENETRTFLINDEVVTVGYSL